MCSIVTRPFPKQAPIGLSDDFPLFEHCTDPSATFVPMALILHPLVVEAKYLGIDDDGDVNAFESNDYAEMRFDDSNENYNINKLINLTIVYIPPNYHALKKQYCNRKLALHKSNQGNTAFRPDKLMQLFHMADTIFNELAHNQQRTLSRPLYGRRMETLARIFKSTDMLQSTPLFDTALEHIYGIFAMGVGTSVETMDLALFYEVYSRAPSIWAGALAAYAFLLHLPKTPPARTVYNQLNAPATWMRTYMRAGRITSCQIP